MEKSFIPVVVVLRRYLDMTVVQLIWLILSKITDVRKSLKTEKTISVFQIKSTGT